MSKWPDCRFSVVVVQSYVSQIRGPSPRKMARQPSKVAAQLEKHPRASHYAACSAFVSAIDFSMRWFDSFMSLSAISESWPTVTRAL